MQAFLSLNRVINSLLYSILVLLSVFKKLRSEKYTFCLVSSIFSRPFFNLLAASPSSLCFSFIKLKTLREQAQWWYSVLQNINNRNMGVALPFVSSYKFQVVGGCNIIMSFHFKQHLFRNIAHRLMYGCKHFGYVWFYLDMIFLQPWLFKCIKIDSCHKWKQKPRVEH